MSETSERLLQTLQSARIALCLVPAREMSTEFMETLHSEYISPAVKAVTQEITDAQNTRHTPPAPADEAVKDALNHHKHVVEVLSGDLRGYQTEIAEIRAKRDSLRVRIRECEAALAAINMDDPPEGYGEPEWMQVLAGDVLRGESGKEFQHATAPANEAVEKIVSDILKDIQFWKDSDENACKSRISAAIAREREEIKRLNDLLALTHSGIDWPTKCDALRREAEQLRAGLSLVATNIGNGSAASPDCSLEFLCVEVPKEVKLVCDSLRQAIEQARDKPSE